MISFLAAAADWVSPSVDYHGLAPEIADERLSRLALAPWGEHAARVPGAPEPRRLTLFDNRHDGAASREFIRAGDAGDAGDAAAEPEGQRVDPCRAHPERARHRAVLGDGAHLQPEPPAPKPLLEN